VEHTAIHFTIRGLLHWNSWAARAFDKAKPAVLPMYVSVAPVGCPTCRSGSS
jgi:uncharacterized protein YyaL (SSP411 family)